MPDGGTALAFTLDQLERGGTDDDVVGALLRQDVEPETLADAHAGAVFLADASGDVHAQRVAHILAQALDRTIERRWAAGSVRPV